MAGDDDIERLRRASSQDAGALVRLADLLVAAGKPHEAVEECKRAVGRMPDEASIRLALARALSSAGELDEAQEVFLVAARMQRAARNAPRTPAAVAAAPPAAAPPASARKPSATPRPQIAAKPAATPRPVVAPKPAAAPLPTLAPIPLVPQDDRGRATPPLGSMALGGPAARPPAHEVVEEEAIEIDADSEEDEETTVGRGRVIAGLAQRAAPAPLKRQGLNDTGEQTAPSPRIDETERTFNERDEPEVRTPTPTPAPSSARMGGNNHYGARAPAGGGGGQARTRAPTPASRPQVRQQSVGPTVSLEAPQRGSVPSNVVGPDGSINLDAVAAQLHDDVGTAWQPSLDPQVPTGDPVQQGFFRARRRAHIWLWASLAAISAGVIGGTWYRIHQIRLMIAQQTQVAHDRSAEATFEGDLAARDALVPVLSSRLHEREHLAFAALIEARLYADHGDEAEGATQAILRRAEREAARKEPERDPPTELNFVRARALVALGHGEPCPSIDVDGVVGARCALRKGDLPLAQQQLTSVLGADGNDNRGLLEQGALAAARGDLDVADDAYARVLKAQPGHPRALVGQALAALDRGKVQPLPPQPKGLGPIGESWWHLALGGAALQKGDEQTAATELDLAQSGAWRDGRLAARVGLAKIALGKVSEAERALRQAARLAPADPELGALDAEIAVAKGFEDKVAGNLAGRDGPPRLLAIRGRAEYLSGKPKEAAQSLEAALVKRPGDVVASTYLALSKARLGRATSAVNDLEKLARQHPDVTTPHYGLGLIAYERHDLATARVELSKALTHDPEAFRAGTWLGRVDAELGRTADAVAELEKVTQDDESLLAAHVTLGHLYHDLGRESEARSELRRVVDAGKANADDQLAYAEALIALSQLTEGDKVLTAAQNAGAPAAAIGRDRLILQAARGGAGAANAARALDKLRRSAPKDQRLALSIAEAWRHAGDGKKAADEFRAAALLGSDKLHPSLGLGRALLQANDAAGAEVAFRAALSAFGGAPYGEEDKTEARVGLGRALLAKKDYADAASTLEAARDEDEGAPEPRFWLAKAYQEVGEAAKARAEVEKAVALDDNYAGAWLLYADLTEKSDKPTAQRALKRYLELVPDGPQTKALKRRLAQLK